MKLILTIFCATALFLPSLAGAQAYQAPMGEESWKLNSTPLSCSMTQMLPDFGGIHFVQHTKHASFKLISWEGQRAGGEVDIIAEAPNWKQPAESWVLESTALKTGRYPVEVGDATTRNMLKELRAGNEMHIVMDATDGDRQRVIISSINFQKTYQKYVQCIGSLLPYNFSDIAFSRIYYAVNTWRLTDDQKVRLRQIAKYLKADPGIRKIKITGFTDGTASIFYNKKLSRKRAIVVKKYLVAMGVNSKKINLYWKGRKDPIAENNTPEGQALNRRVEIVLEK